MLSEEATRFLESQERVLLERKKAGLQRCIHLLRMVGKKPNPLFGLPAGILDAVFGDMLLVPDGHAWGALIKLIHRNLTAFNNAELALILGLLEDWKAGIKAGANQMAHAKPD